MKPKVTVVVTVYKRTRFLREALDSVLAQSYQNFEIIVTDDSNSDEIRKICECYQSSNVRYRTNPTNLGVTRNLEKAFLEARGDYISILNDDDTWEPLFLDKLTALLDEDPQASLAFSDHWVMTDDGTIDIAHSERLTRQYGRHLLVRGRVPDLAELVLKWNGVPLAMAGMFRKDALNTGLLVDEIQGAYDFWISCLFAAQNRIACYEPERLTRYRSHAAMETARQAPDRNDNMVFIFSKLREMQGLSRWDDLLKTLHGNAHYRAGGSRMRFGEKKRARYHFWQTWIISHNVKALARYCLSFLPG